MLVLTLAVTVTVVPKSAPYNQVLLLPGILLVVQRWRTLWANNRGTRIIVLISSFLILWPWLAAASLTAASLFLPHESVQKAWAVPLYTSFAIPIAVLVLLSLCLREVTVFREPAQ